MLTIDQAHRIIAAGEAHAHGIGESVSIAVLDAGAHLRAFGLMDGAVLGSIDVATGKARTAVLFNAAAKRCGNIASPAA